MSRLGKQPIVIPDKVSALLEGDTLKVTGPKGELTRQIPKAITVSITDNTIVVEPNGSAGTAKALWGTMAAHFNNMITGVTEGFIKVLEVVGVGYRCEVKGNLLVLNVGFSHPVELLVPAGLTVTVEKNIITIVGFDKDVVGQFAANVRQVKKPEPYKGKGIRYRGEFIIRKQGKKAVA